MVKCQQCEYWKKSNPGLPDAPGREPAGTCHRYAPSALSGKWPHTRASDGCGDGRLRASVDVER